MVTVVKESSLKIYFQRQKIVTLEGDPPQRGLVGGNRGNDEGRLETTLESNTMVPAAPGLAPALGCLTWPGALPLAARLRGICRWGCSLCSTASSSCICLPRPGEEDWRRGGSIAKVGVPNSRSAAYCFCTGKR